ncbi:amidohydrolase family protein [Streptomyces sp. bgisy153]|uniref:amidohydrolase family protein n=1 Tax=Streptomyces sp. bgisy153 TaxID=3413793 RepID=UPI003D7421B0
MVTEADWTAWRTADLRPYWDTVLDAFGPDRLMFGSGWPVCTLAAGYAQVVQAVDAPSGEPGRDERHQLFEATATRVYGLRAGPASRVGGRNSRT